MELRGPCFLGSSPLPCHPPPACAPWGFRAAQLSRAEESRLHPCSSVATSFPQPLTPQCAPLWCVSVLPFPPFPPSPSQPFFRASDYLLTHLRVSAPVASSSFPWCPSVHFPERSWIVVSSLPPVGIARALKNADARLTPRPPVGPGAVWRPSAGVLVILTDGSA